MIPTKLRLKNFIGIKSGLGRDELVLDLEKMSDGAQLVALVGPNGMGKSTILDNLHPYRLMPSRAGSYSPGSFSFYENIYGAEAVKELEFQHEGKYYRSVLVFKMGTKTKKTECYLQVMDSNGNWLPVHLSDGTSSDGKSETYDRCLEAILGTPELFFTSAFAAQNRKSLSSYTNGEIKGLLSELLGLEHIVELGQKASSVVKLFRSRLDGMRAGMERIDTLEQERAQVDVEHDNAKDHLGFTMQARHAVRERVATATRNVESARAELGATAEIEQRRVSLTTQLSTVKTRIGDTLKQIDTDVTTERNRAASAATSLRAEVGRHEASIRSNEQQITKNRELIGKKGEIEKAVTDLKELEANDLKLFHLVEQRRTNATKYRALEKEKSTIAERLKASTKEGLQLKASCEELHGRAALIDNVPCKGMELQTRCELLANANQAKNSIPASEESLKASREAYQALQAKGREIESALELLGDAEADLTKAEQDKRDNDAKIRSLTAIAGQAASLANAEEAIRHATAQIEELRSAIANKSAEIDRIEADCSIRFSELATRRRAAEEQASAEILAIEHDLEALPPPADQSALTKAQAVLKQIEEEQQKTDLEYEQLTARVANCKERLQQIQRDLANADSYRAIVGTIETEISRWTTLSKALSNDGIVALSIDDAGPTLAGIANDLLLSVYGPRFSLKLVTQEENASGDMKETFDIIVFDADRDEEKSVRDMSGGERIYINDALTRAIAIYQAQASGQKYACLFSDESDGALDTEKKVQFVKMKREVLRIGNYQREIYISHSPEVQECADATINLLEFRQ